MKNIKRILIFLILVISLFAGESRLIYGVWNPFAIPNRIEYSLRTYNKAEINMEAPGKMHQLFSVNQLLGKRIFATQPRGKVVPTAIFLYIGRGKYITYSLSGGP